METYELKFESNCDYDGAIEYFKKQLATIKQIKCPIGRYDVFKDGDIWIIKQEVVLTFGARFKLIWLKLLNKFN